jgi:hypothetical protein
MMGGSFDIDRAVTSDEALTVLGQAIPPESTAKRGEPCTKSARPS